MKMNSNNQVILNDNDVIRAWLKERSIQRAIFEDPEPINIYNEWCQSQDISETIQVLEEDTSLDYAEKCIQRWNMSKEYETLDILSFLLDKCSTDEQIQRVKFEYAEFERRGLKDVLRFLKYVVDLCREEDIVLGVGRGSSVASYCLYLLGVHKIDSLKYKLDIGEFLK